MLSVSKQGDCVSEDSTEILSVAELDVPLNWERLDAEPEITERKNELAEIVEVPAVLWTPEQVTDSIDRGADIILARQREGNMPMNTLYASMLNGSQPFEVRLINSLMTKDPSQTPFVDYIDASRYGKSQIGREQLRITRNFRSETWYDIITGRFDHVEEVDDVIDGGHSSVMLAEHIKMVADRARERGLRPDTDITFGITALVRKDLKQIDMGVFKNVTGLITGPDVWLSGMGMDGPREHMRRLPFIVVSQAQDEKYEENFPQVMEHLRHNGYEGASVVNEEATDSVFWVPPSPEVEAEEIIGEFDVDAFIDRVLSENDHSVAK